MLLSLQRPTRKNKMWKLWSRIAIKKSWNLMFCRHHKGHRKLALECTPKIGTRMHHIGHRKLAPKKDIILPLSKSFSFSPCASPPPFAFAPSPLHPKRRRLLDIGRLAWAGFLNPHIGSHNSHIYLDGPGWKIQLVVACVQNSKIKVKNGYTFQCFVFALAYLKLPYLVYPHA